MNIGEIVVVGGTISAAVAVERLAAKGENVRWLHPGIRIGGGFRQVNIGGRLLNLGSRLLELCYVEGEETLPVPPLDRYLAGHDGHRPWQRMVANYLTDLAGDEFFIVREPELFWNGVRDKDIYFTSELKYLRRYLSTDKCRSIAAECSAILNSSPDEGIHKTALDLKYFDFFLASQENHGQTFHTEFIEVLAQKLRPNGTVGISAYDRNKLWLPLYWPRTLWEATTGRLVSYSPNRVFRVDASGGTCSVLARLENRLLKSSNITAENVGHLKHAKSERGKFTLQFSKGSTVQSDKVILGVPPEELFAATDINYQPKRLIVGIVWIEVAIEELIQEPPSVLVIADEQSPIYRIADSGSNVPQGRRTFSIQLSHDQLALSMEALTHELVRIAFLHEDATPIELGRKSFLAFIDPTIENRQHFDIATDLFRDQHGEVPIVGPAAAFGSDPFNEQIFQGIQISETLT